jgi:prepilin-type N-terminal cleavage/methylation domain-containing protein
MNRFPSQISGFTLLEILLALAILALVLSSLFSAYSETITATELVETSREVDQAARTLPIDFRVGARSRTRRRSRS